MRVLTSLVRRLAGGIVLLALLPAVAGASQEPRLLVEEATERVLAALESEGERVERDPQRLYGLVDEIILPHFDFRQMSRRVLGRHWRGASPAQQARFVEEFRTLLVRTYATALADYSDAEVNVRPVRAAADADRVLVRTEVRPPAAPPFPVSYAMYRNDESWKVYDVSVDGVSLVITYRSSFSDEIQRNGIDSLVERLASRNRGGEEP